MCFIDFFYLPYLLFMQSLITIGFSEIKQISNLVYEARGLQFDNVDLRIKTQLFYAQQESSLAGLRQKCLHFFVCECLTTVCLCIWCWIPLCQNWEYMFAWYNWIWFPIPIKSLRINDNCQLVCLINIRHIAI